MRERGRHKRELWVPGLDMSIAIDVGFLLKRRKLKPDVEEHLYHLVKKDFQVILVALRYREAFLERIFQNCRYAELHRFRRAELLQEFFGYRDDIHWFVANPDRQWIAGHGIPKKSFSDWDSVFREVRL